MEARIVFAPVTHVSAEAVCTRLVYKSSGELFDNWQDLSANRDIIQAVGMNFHNQVFGLRFSPRDRPVFVVNDTQVGRSPVKKVIFHAVRGGYTDDTGSYMYWMDAADNNNIASIALPLTITPDFIYEWSEPESEDQLRQTLLTYVVSAYSAYVANGDKQRLRSVCFAIDPRLQKFEGDVMQIWREAIRRDAED